MAKTVSQKEKMEQKLGRLQLESMKLSGDIQVRQERLNAVRKQQAEVAQRLIQLECKTEDYHGKSIKQINSD